MAGPEPPAFPTPSGAPARHLGSVCAGLSAAAFLLSPEAGLAAGSASLALLFLLSPRRDRDFGLLLIVLGLGILAAARSLYPGLGTLLGGAYLLARSRWGPGAASPPAASPRRQGTQQAGRGGPGSPLLGNRTLYELVTALGAVALVVALLQAGTATWPAMVAVESCSMEPNIRVGDLVLVAGPARAPVVTQAGQLVEFQGPGRSPVVSDASAARSGGAPPPDVEAARAEDPALLPSHRAFALASGCVAAEPSDSQGNSRGCRTRGEPVAGDVIVFYPNGNTACTPIIHRARLWIPDNTTLANRTFERGGFITKGDNNGPPAGFDPLQAADQVANRPRGTGDLLAIRGTGAGRGACPVTEPVRPEWLVGVAQFRIPWLGYVRLLLGRTEPCGTGL